MLSDSDHNWSQRCIANLRSIHNPVEDILIVTAHQGTISLLEIAIQQWENLLNERPKQ